MATHVMVYALFFLAIAIPLGFFIRILKKYLFPSTEVAEPMDTPDLDELEKKLANLIEINQSNLKNKELHDELNNTKTHIIASYLALHKQFPKDGNLFCLIIRLIKNKEDDRKIIRIMRHYLPSASTTHLYAILNSMKLFLYISLKDKKTQILMKDLQKNNIKSILFYLEQKLNNTLKKISLVPPRLQPILIEEAAKIGLIFATFAEFYNTRATEKMLNLVETLAPNLMKNWHTLPIKSSKIRKNTALSKSKIALIR